MNEKRFENIYEEYCGNLGFAPDRVKKAYQAMQDAFEEYLCAVEEWTFRTAFDFGQNYATKKEMRKVV